MREYLEWQLAEGRVRIRIHRRVLAGLEQEDAAEVRGLLLGTAAPGTYEVQVDDYASLTAGTNSLPAVGYFRVAPGGAALSDEDREAFLSRFEDPLSVLLLLERNADGVIPAQLLLRSGAGPDRVLSGAHSAPGHRVLFREGLPDETKVEPESEDRSPRRFLWPVVAIAAGLATGVFGYLAMNGETRTQQNRAATPVDRTPVPASGEATAAIPARETPSNQADRSMDPVKPLTRAERSEIQKEIRGVLTNWSESLLRGDLEAYAGLYAPSVGPYFTRNQASRAEVEEEVRRMVKRYGAVTAYKISDVTISPVDANHAIANFRKQWGTAGRKFAGEDREQLKFVRDGDEWRIASEQELKVYWVRKK